MNDRMAFRGHGYHSHFASDAYNSLKLLKHRARRENPDTASMLQIGMCIILGYMAGKMLLAAINKK